MTQPRALSAEVLLQHEPFVRAVVRGLLSDEARVQDVVQETWLRALRQPPRSEGSLRSWLARVARNLARDSHRSQDRRTAREHAAARTDRVESVEQTYERLATQREVVDCVLSLEEPYQGVVLLRYFQDLDTDEIAERLDRSPATVRSQLSRGHAILRARLETKFPGRRSTWAVLALPGATKASGFGSLGKLWATPLVKVAVGVLVVGTLALSLRPDRGGEPEPDGEPALALAGGVPTRETRARGGSLTSDRDPDVAGVRRPGGAPSPTLQDLAQRARLDTRTVPQLFELAVQTQRAIEAQLLAVDPRLVERHAQLLTRPDTGICRLLERGPAGPPHANAITRREGGTYFSFSTRDHSYDAEPDLAFRQGEFDAGFYGHQVGMLLAIGDVPLVEVPDQAGSVPPDLDGSARQDWSVLWSDLTLPDAAHGSEFRARNERLWRSDARFRADTTYLLRMFSPREHDHLVAFRPVSRDELGCVLVWRVLKTWPVPGQWQGAPDRRGEHLEVPPGPDWMDEASLAELLEFLGQVRAQAHAPLLEVADEERQRFVDFVERVSFADRSGFARILHRGRWDPLVPSRDFGAYYSFLTDEQAFGRDSELVLELDRFQSGVVGNSFGFLLDLGEIPVPELGAVMSGGEPGRMSERQRAAWSFLHAPRSTVQETETGPRSGLAEKELARADELGLRGPVPALVGHTYLLRSTNLDRHDHLVVFTVIGGDEFGLTLAWNILRSWPLDAPPRDR